MIFHLPWRWPLAREMNCYGNNDAHGWAGRSGISTGYQSRAGDSNNVRHARHAAILSLRPSVKFGNISEVLVGQEPADDKSRQVIIYVASI